MNTYVKAPRRLPVVASMLVAALAIAGCGDDDETSEPPATPVATPDATPTTGSGNETGPPGSTAGSAPATTATSEATVGEPVEMTEVSFQTFPNLAMGVPIKVATEQGIFEANGLQVTASEGATGPAMVSALAAGQVDLAGVPNFVGMQSNVAGAGLQAVVGLTGGGGSLLFAGNQIPKPDTDYPESAQVLNDAVLGAAAPGGFTERLYNFLIEDAGITGTQIVTVAGIPESLAAIQAGRTDVANFDLIGAYRGEQEGIGYTLYDFQETGPQEFRGASTNAVWATADFIENNPDAAEAFARSIAQADAWLQDPANAEAARSYFADVAAVEVPDDLLDKLLTSLKPIVGPDDLNPYVQLLDDPGGFDVAGSLSSVVPQDEAALNQLVGS